MAASNSKLSMTNFLEYARVGLVFLGIMLLVVTIFQIGMSAIRTMSGTVEVANYELPDYAFGQVPGIRFPYVDASLRPGDYVLRLSAWPYFGEPTVQGLTMVNVYQLQTMSYSLTADQKARQIAQNLGFYEEPRIIDQRTYLYNYPGPPLSETLQIDLKTLFLKFSTNYLASANIFGTLDSRGNRQIPQRKDAIDAARLFLQDAGLLPDDLSDEASTVNYMTSIGDSLQPVNSALEADYAVVNFARRPVQATTNGEPAYFNFYGPDGYGSIQAVVGRDSYGNDVVVELTDNYYAMNLDTVGTYPIRTAADAYNSLLAGDAYVINPRGVRQAVITSIELGYYESHGEQDFLLPIYVFKGENDFVAYVQALYPGMYY